MMKWDFKPKAQGNLEIKPSFYFEMQFSFLWMKLCPLSQRKWTQGFSSTKVILFAICIAICIGTETHFNILNKFSKRFILREKHKVKNVSAVFMLQSPTKFHQFVFSNPAAMNGCSFH